MRPALLVHTCCGPCAAGAVPLLRGQGYELVAYFANPNVQPAMEWIRRLEAFEAYCASAAVPSDFEPSYDLERFLREVYADGTEGRCGRCFRQRLALTAARARSVSIPAMTSTLLASPHQDLELVRSVGHEVARAYGLRFVDPDLRPGFAAGQAAARELGLYRQPYCGCLFSEKERYARRLARAYARRAGPPQGE